MSLTAEDIIGSANDHARAILQDSAKVRWTDAELFDWLNEAQMAIVNMHPAAIATRETITLVAGITQAIPATFHSLLNILYNLDGSGDPESSITPVSEDLLRAENPQWPSDTADDEVLHFMLSANDSRAFRVYPPQPGATTRTVQAEVANYPTPVTALSSPLDFEDSYQPMLIDYLLYRAFSKDSDNEANDKLAMKHFSQFRTGVTELAQMGG